LSLLLYLKIVAIHYLPLHFKAISAALLKMIPLQRQHLLAHHHLVFPPRIEDTFALIFINTCKQKASTLTINHLNEKRLDFTILDVV
jgi:hypothetical protein